MKISEYAKREKEYTPWDENDWKTILFRLNKMEKNLKKNNTTFKGRLEKTTGPANQ